MISKRAIDDFLSRPLRDSSRAKQFTDRALDAKLAKLDPPPQFVYPPRKHQKVSFLLGIKHHHYLLFLDMGTGKTAIALNLFSYRRRLADKGGSDLEASLHEGRPPNTKNKAGWSPPLLRMLVLVPGGSNLGQWVAEVKKHAPHLTAIAVDGVGEGERMLQVRSNADVVIITYAGFLSLICGRKEKVGRVGKKWVIDKKKLREWQKLFKFVCPDESTVAFKNAQSLTCRACKQLSWSADYAYALTGTPQDTSPQDLWAQFNVIDRGETLGETLGLFREVFFTGKPNYWGGMEWKFKEKMRGKLNRMIRHNSIRYAEEECEDLPKRVHIVRPVRMPKETYAYYDKLVTELNESHKQGLHATQNSFVRMRQLCSGYLSVKGEEANIKIRFKYNPKLDALVELMEEIPKDRKVVIFLEYVQPGCSMDIVCEALKKAKVKHVRLYSGTANKTREVDRFLNDPSVRAIVSSSAGAFGGNWQAANYVIFFESPVRPMFRKQMLKRIHRMGQHRTCFVYDIVISGSIETRILKSLKRGEDLFQQIIEGKVKV